MEGMKQEQDPLLTLPSMELIESCLPVGADTNTTVIAPLFVIMPTDIDRDDHQSTAVSCADIYAIHCIVRA